MTPLSVMERLPVPSLRLYSSLSIALLSATLYYAVSSTARPAPAPIKLDLEEPWVTIPPDNSTKPLLQHLGDTATFMVQEPVCIGTLINTAYCCLFLVARSIQKIVFGELRVSERQHVKDKFWNFAFYKFIFVFGVINVQYTDEVVLWVVWFTILGFFHLLSQLCKDRFEYLSFSASSGGWAGARLAGLLVIVLVVAGALLITCGAVAYYGGGFNTFAFMSVECILLMIRTTHVLFKYAMHVLESRTPTPGETTEQLGTGSGFEAESETHLTSRNTSTRDKRAPLAHYAELVFELAALAVDAVHHIHMLLWSNIFLSMASLVICMQLRYLFNEIQRRVKKHRNYLWVLKHMEKNYPMATPEELQANSDNCAICWEKMDTARRLPCGHLFHNSCLSSWLQQDTSCPTCRLGLSLWPPVSSNANSHTANRHPNHFFHFDGSRYVSWLPSFSVEVTHMMRGELPATNSQMDAMARQVQQLFPHFPLSIIVADLQSTRSVEMTVENILDGRIILPTRLVTIEPNAAENNTTTPNTRVRNPLIIRSGVAVSPGVQLPNLLLAQNLQPLANSQVVWLHSLSMLTEYVNRQQQRQRQNQPQPAATTEDRPNESENPVSNDGSEFHINSHEREKVLQKRKEQLINNARKKYLEKNGLNNKDENAINKECLSQRNDEPEPSTSTAESNT